MLVAIHSISLENSMYVAGLVIRGERGPPLCATTSYISRTSIQIMMYMDQHHIHGVQGPKGKIVIVIIVIVIIMTGRILSCGHITA